MPRGGLVDEILIHVTPVLLGDRVRLFNRPVVSLKRMRTSVLESGQVTALRFSVQR